jgi:glycosyltransferase involved in cell wall biosynthesis
MRIAFIVPYVPNQIRTRSYNLIMHLSKLGHEVDVFTVGSNNTDRQDARFLQSKCAKVVYYHQPLWRSVANAAGALFSRRPLQSVYSWQPDLLRDFVRIFDQNRGLPYDIVHVEHLRGSRYGVELKARFPNQPVVWDSVDCISHLFKQASAESTDLFGKLITRFELGRTRRLEGYLLSCFDHILVTSSIDRDALLGLSLNGTRPAPISVISNGVDQIFFHPNPLIQREPETLVFSGKMSYHANISMVKYLVADIMPRIWKTHPGARLYIVGKDPSSEVKEFETNPLIKVTGTVDDIRPFLWRATVSVVPLLYGAGIQNKILEAMATKTPVVTTFKALSALQVQSGKELLAAHDSEDFSHAVVQLIEDRKLQNQMGQEGAAYVETHHNWLSISAGLVELYQQTIDLKQHSFKSC